MHNEQNGLFAASKSSPQVRFRTFLDLDKARGTTFGAHGANPVWEAAARRFRHRLTANDATS
jgi:hypothetical protein